MRVGFTFTMPFLQRFRFLFTGWLYLEVHCKGKIIQTVTGQVTTKKAIINEQQSKL